MKLKFSKKWQVIPYEEIEPTLEQKEKEEEIKFQDILKSNTVDQDKYKKFNQKFKLFNDKKSNRDFNYKQQDKNMSEPDNEKFIDSKEKISTDFHKTDDYKKLEDKIDYLYNSNNNEFGKLYNNINTILSNIQMPNEDLYRMTSHSTRSKKRNRLNDEITDKLKALNKANKLLSKSNKSSNTSLEASLLRAPTKDRKKPSIQKSVKNTQMQELSSPSIPRWEGSSSIKETGFGNNTVIMSDEEYY